MPLEYRVRGSEVAISQFQGKRWTREAEGVTISLEVERIGFTILHAALAFWH